MINPQVLKLIRPSNKFRLKPYLYVLGFFLLVLNCKESPPEQNTLFTHLSSTESGVSFVNQIENSSELNILNYLYFYNGAGVAVSDFNNDGLSDIYFTANQTEDQLYLNKGGLTFKEITTESGIKNDKPWTTGVTIVDINNDGFLDIYVCKVGSFRSISGHNLLFVNQGVNEDGIPTFEEQSANYGLNISSFSTQASFFDYDLDGDLDMFLLNHSVFPNRSYGKGSKRKSINEQSGDKLFENIDGKYVEVTAQANIFQGEIGYGLGLGISDINNDLFPDIYVGNDFFENDYLYLNQGNGSFKELISSDEKLLGHTTHFSMGNDLADINNDGFTDIISVDMLPEDLSTYKTSAQEYNFQIYSNYLRNGYAAQFMQNTLHINRQNLKFSETAHLSGIAATEWSWSPLIADFDNDGWNDVFVSNGILGATNDMDFINFIANENIQEQIENGLSSEDLKFIERLPVKKTKNYMYRNEGQNQFSDQQKDWLNSPESFSNGAVYADLDNDGDLDLVVNNVNDEAFIIRNNAESELGTNYLTVSFIGSELNNQGIGSKVSVYSGDNFQAKEHFVTRGYQSAVDHGLHFGLGNQDKIDSLKIRWPDGKEQTMVDVPANQKLTINYQEATTPSLSEQREQEESSSAAIIPFAHSDNTTIEFNRDPLIPFATTNMGPDISVADINNDGLNDIFLSGGKGQASSMFVQQTDGSFSSSQNELFDLHKLNEDVAHEFGDVNNDGFVDLIVVSGGNEFKNGKAIWPRLYLNSDGSFEYDNSQFQNININASSVKLSDFDNDGDLDVCITSDTDADQFGKSVRQYLFVNDGKGGFTDQTEILAPDFQNVGNVKDVAFYDMNADGLKDMIVVGYWMPVTIYYNDGKEFKRGIDQFDDTNGWWNTVEVADFDNDGDQDLIVGNWGLNSRLKANLEEPITLYSYDFDNNGSVEPIVTYYYQQEETTFASKEELSKQMPFINKDFLTHDEFAKASVKEVFTDEKLKKAMKKKVFELATCYFENVDNKRFIKHQLPFFGQISSVNDILVHDFNKDGYFDVLFAGNYYEISTQLSRLDASHGELFMNDKNGGFYHVPNQHVDISGVVRNLDIIAIDGVEYVVFARNNDSPLLLNLEKFKQ